jgi:hypothetical protein
VSTLYVFERPPGGGSWFAGRVRQRRFTGGQLTEGVCWVGDDVVVTNEAGQIFELSSKDLSPFVQR